MNIKQKSSNIFKINIISTSAPCLQQIHNVCSGNVFSNIPIKEDFDGKKKKKQRPLKFESPLQPNVDEQASMDTTGHALIYLDDYKWMLSTIMPSQLWNYVWGVTLSLLMAWSDLVWITNGCKRGWCLQANKQIFDSQCGSPVILFLLSGVGVFAFCVQKYREFLTVQYLPDKLWIKG